MKPTSILLTDDESTIRTALRAALETDGYTVAEAADGREALLAMQAHMPDLVVLDLNMPVLDGLGVLAELQKLAAGHHPKVIVLTAYGSLKTAVRATRLGAIDFLEKPITPIELRQTVRSVLNEPEMDAPPQVRLDFPGGYEAALDRIRKSLRLADYGNAAVLLSKAAEHNRMASAEYYNLLGVLYEAQHQWRLARKCYGKAIDADKQFDAAQANMRRLYELQKYGRSAQGVRLGDASDDLWYARMPDPAKAAS